MEEIISENFEQSLDVPFLMEIKSFPDDRGEYKVIADFEKYKFKSTQISRSISNAGVFRGLHYQEDPFQQAKIISVIRGSILDFAVNLKTGDVYIFEMNTEVHLYIPRGYAHGFLALETNTEIEYLVDNVYSPGSEKVLSPITFPQIMEAIGKHFSAITISIKDLRKSKNLSIKDIDYSEPLAPAEGCKGRTFRG